MAGLVVLLFGYLIVRNEPIADPNLVVILRVFVSVCAGIFGATIPGTLHFGWKGAGTTIRATSAVGFFAIAYLFTPGVLPQPQQQQPQSSSEQPKASSLVLRVEEPNPDPDKPDTRKPAINEPHIGVVQRVAFTLANPTTGLATIDEMAVEVVDVIENHTGFAQAVVQNYKYPVDLTPRKGNFPFGEKPKYAPGEVDRFSLGLLSDMGYDYFIRVKVKWFDQSTGENRLNVSDLMVLTFPAPFPQGTPLTQQGKLSDEHQAKVKARLQQLRKP